jgi:hypothetical protein
VRFSFPLPRWLFPLGVDPTTFFDHQPPYKATGGESPAHERLKRALATAALGAGWRVKFEGIVNPRVANVVCVNGERVAALEAVQSGFGALPRAHLEMKTPTFWFSWLSVWRKIPGVPLHIADAHLPETVAQCLAKVAPYVEELPSAAQIITTFRLPQMIEHVADLAPEIQHRLGQACRKILLDRRYRRRAIELIEFCPEDSLHLLGTTPEEIECAQYQRRHLDGLGL